MARNTHANIVEGAKQRALIVTFLSNHPGEHDAKSVAFGTKLSGQTVGQLLKHMSETGLVPKPRVDGTKRFYRWEGDPPTAEQLSKLPDVLAAASPVPISDGSTKRRRTSTAKEIELVINGTEIVVGRNPTTGRIRVILEDVSS